MPGRPERRSQKKVLSLGGLETRRVLNRTEISLLNEGYKRGWIEPGHLLEAIRQANQQGSSIPLNMILQRFRMRKKALKK